MVVLIDQAKLQSHMSIVKGCIVKYKNNFFFFFIKLITENDNIFSFVHLNTILKKN